MIPNITRRRALKALGAGAITGAFPSPVAASGRPRVFVHPDGPQSQAVDAIQDHGGRAIFVYDSFDFIAGVVPQKNRRDLARDNRVSRVDKDHRASLIEPVHHRTGHDGGPPGGGDDDGDGGCNDHPNQVLPWGVDRIDAELVEHDGSNIAVGVIDTGIDKDHCDLKGNLAGGHNCTQTGPSRDWDANGGHGTHVAGIIGAENNGIGVRGVSENPDLYGLRVKDNSGAIYWSYVVCAIDWCVNHGIPIMNMSIGGPDNQSVGDAIDAAYSSGHLLVAAAGNESDDTEPLECSNNNVIFPASHPNVVSVSAIEEHDDMADYTSVGDAPDSRELDDSDTDDDIEIAAPGGGDTDEDGEYERSELIKSCWEDDGYAWAAGTSMASPHVAGVAALLWDASGTDAPDIDTRDTVRNALNDSADDLGHPSCMQGSGLVDADEAIKLV